MNNNFLLSDPPGVGPLSYGSALPLHQHILKDFVAVRIHDGDEICIKENEIRRCCI